MLVTKQVFLYIDNVYTPSQLIFDPSKIYGFFLGKQNIWLRGREN